MMDWILGQPFLIAAGCLTGLAGFRSQCTYWLGRGIRAGVVRGRWADKLTSEKERSVVAKLEKWGWPLIPLSFLTLGFQTAVQLTAGVIGWRWLRYTLAAIPGWILWGCLYAAGGLAVFVAFFTLAGISWWLFVLVLLALIGLIVAIIMLRRRHRARAEAALIATTNEPALPEDGLVKEASVNAVE
ncbi:MAG: hypothetical protein LBE83_01615 [Propionibacteriaceae bacterium]|jgi:membrane protein DedA with SNARE-associated domain|nr:hypothetical protein [Propionibacteriaceae bacterium]